MFRLFRRRKKFRALPRAQVWAGEI